MRRSIGFGGFTFRTARARRGVLTGQQFAVTAAFSSSEWHEDRGAD
jgi:hypothetical protein